MNNRKKSDNTAAGTAKTLKDRIFNLVITVLAVLFVILIAGFLYKVRGYGSSVYTSSSYGILTDLNRSSFKDAVNATWRNRACGVTDSDSSYVVPYALSDYYMASFYETACRNAGNTAKADALAAQKAGYREKAGSLWMIADEIDSLLSPYGK